MEITWEFADGKTTKAEADVKIGTFILDSRREEANGDRKHRAHNYSLDAITYEGKEYGREDKYPSMDDSAEEARRVRMAFRRLTTTQQRRLWRHVVERTSLREIARLEHVSVESVSESVAGAQKKFLKFWGKTP